MRNPRWALVSALVKVFRCGPRRDICRERSGRPALENLPRWKLRGSGRDLWGKCSFPGRMPNLALLVWAMGGVE